MKHLNKEKIISSLQEGGVVAKKLSNYEPRQSQLDLMENLIDAFNENALLMAEAGTGVGKSFAYLLPAIHFALDNKEKVIISTATITLQQQLFEKDIPLVSSTMEKEVKSVLMKGRNNYVCLRRFYEATEEGSLFEIEANELKQITNWLKESKTGEKSEISFLPSSSLWNKIASESDLCLGNHCRFRDDCFIFKLRQKANAAHILVVNHHLLFADLAARFHGAGYEQSVVLPPFSRLILDEAHTIENAATSFFSSEFSKPGILKNLSRLYTKKKGNEYGLLVRLSALLPSSLNILKTSNDFIEKIRTLSEDLEDAAIEVCAGENIYRLSQSSDENYLNRSLFPPLKKLKDTIHSFACMIREVCDNLEDKEGSDPSVWEIKTIINRLITIKEICEVFLKYKKHQDQILWIEIRNYSMQELSKKNSVAVFTQAPLNLAPILKDSVYKPNLTVACVSATLAINNDFSYWATRCGFNLVENRTILSGCFPSPFPYSESVLLNCPFDAPLPDTDPHNYQEFINKAVFELISIAQGSALVLFTSYRSLIETHEVVSSNLAMKMEMNIRCLKQGDDDRSRLLQEFLNDTNSCLFATDSFWEGVDAPGNTLKMVIICRLPFRTPGDPILEARREDIVKKGGNPFMELTLPQAVMKFKQGFGRLMRRNTDHGVVTILDSRFLKKSYGKLFLASLPQTGTAFKNLENILIDIERFLY